MLFIILHIYVRLIASTVIALSWALTPDDINCNLMPLFHVGGIVRQIFSVWLSGSQVICTPRFDPEVFWQLLEKNGFTWYYASPTMHQHILDAASQYDHLQPKLRMIANAAGGLLPSTAEKLRDCFKGANVLPSYGMTEVRFILYCVVVACSRSDLCIIL